MPLKIFVVNKPLVKMTTKLPKVPTEIEALVPYQPGKPIEELERELGISGAIKAGQQ